MKNEIINYETKIGNNGEVYLRVETTVGEVYEFYPHTDSWKLISPSRQVIEESFSRFKDKK